MEEALSRGVPLSAFDGENSAAQLSRSPSKATMSVARTTKALLTVAAATTMALATGPAQAAACLVSDVTLKIGSTVYAPSACGDGVDQGGGPIAETNSLNAVLDTAGFVYLDSSEDAGTPAGINGIAFVV